MSPTARIPSPRGCTPRPTEAHRQLAARLLFDQGPGPETTGAAVRRVHAGLIGGLAPILGAAGVQGLFARSVRLVRDESAPLAALLDPEHPSPGVDRLSACLDQLPRATGQDAAIAVYGTLVALLATFIGDSLCEHLVRAAFPALESTRPKGTT